MINKVKRFYILFIGVLLGGFAYGQDPAFSQIFNNRVYLNPAFVGVDEGHRVALTHRNMWRTLPRHYVTTTATYDFKPCAFPRIGLGLVAMSNTEGDGRLKSTEGGFVFAVHNPFSFSRRRKDHTAGAISFALQTTFISRSIDWDKLVFGDQLDPVMGVVLPKSAQVSPEFRPVNNVDFAAGFLWRQRLYFSKRLDMSMHLGAAIHHIFKPQEGLLVNGIMPQKLTVHGGVLIPLSKYNYIIPGFRYLGQNLQLSNHKVFDINAMYLNRKVFGGASYRINPVNYYFKQTDAVVFFAGYEFDLSKETSLRMTYSFDTNFKGVSSGNFFTHEINIILFNLSKCRNDLARLNKNICDYQGKGVPKIF